jgi:hypothetical protein
MRRPRTGAGALDEGRHGYLNRAIASTPTIKRMLGDSGEDQFLADPRRS